MDRFFYYFKPIRWDELSVGDLFVWTINSSRDILFIKEKTGDTGYKFLEESYTNACLTKHRMSPEIKVCKVVRIKPIKDSVTFGALKVGEHFVFWTERDLSFILRPEHVCTKFSEHEYIFDKDSEYIPPEARVVRVVSKRGKYVFA